MNSEFTLVWDTVKIFLAVFLGWIISRLGQFIEKRKEKKITKKKFIELFTTFKNLDTLNSIRLIKSLGMDKIEEVFGAIGSIWYDPKKQGDDRYIITKDLENIRVRIDCIENWMVILGYGGGQLIMNPNIEGKQFEFLSPDRNRKVLDEFLKFLKKRYENYGYNLDNTFFNE